MCYKSGTTLRATVAQRLSGGRRSGRRTGEEGEFSLPVLLPIPPGEPLRRRSEAQSSQNITNGWKTKAFVRICVCSCDRTKWPYGVCNVAARALGQPLTWECILGMAGGAGIVDRMECVCVWGGGGGGGGRGEGGGDGEGEKGRCSNYRPYSILDCSSYFIFVKVNTT